MKSWLFGIVLTVAMGLPIQQVFSDQLVYADFEHIEDGRPVSARGGQVFLYGYEQNKKRPSEYTNWDDTSPAPKLHPRGNGMSQRAAFDFEIKAPNDYAGVGLAVYGQLDDGLRPTAEDVSRYDYLTFQIAVEGTQTIRVHLISEGNGIDLPAGTYPQFDITVRPQFTPYRLKLERFIQPDWARRKVETRSVLKKLTAIHFVVNTPKSKGKVVIDNIIFIREKKNSKTK